MLRVKNEAKNDREARCAVVIAQNRHSAATIGATSVGASSAAVSEASGVLATNGGGGDDDENDYEGVPGCADAHPNGAVHAAGDEDDFLLLVLSNDDLLLRVMKCVGPRSVRSGIGSSSRRLRDLSASNVLWKAFWDVRSLRRRRREVTRCEEDGDVSTEDSVVVHDAARVFRVSEPDVRRLASSTPLAGVGYPVVRAGDNALDHSGFCYFEAYVRIHYLMRLTNLRPKKVAAGGGSISQTTAGASREIEPSAPMLQHLHSSHEMSPPLNLDQVLCTQTWRGRLSTNTGENEIPGATVMCNNAAESWCDHPTCRNARCGKYRCLRAYRFDVDYSDRDDEEISPAYFRCSWCSASFCRSHAGERPSGWTCCDDCLRSACSPECAAEVFIARPVRCTVVHRSRACQRSSCVDTCARRVVRKGRWEGQRQSGSGGECEKAIVVERFSTNNFSSSTSQEDGTWGLQDAETCCSRCIDAAVTRMEEFAAIEGAFGGLIP